MRMAALPVYGLRAYITSLSVTIQHVNHHTYVAL